MDIALSTMKLQTCHEMSVRCIAVTQSHEEIRCKITTPIACELTYIMNSMQDTIEIWNRSRTPFRLSYIFECGITADRLSVDRAIESYDHQIAPCVIIMFSYIPSGLWTDDKSPVLALQALDPVHSYAKEITEAFSPFDLPQLQRQT